MSWFCKGDIGFIFEEIKDLHGWKSWCLKFTSGSLIWISHSRRTELKWTLCVCFCGPILTKCGRLSIRVITWCSKKQNKSHFFESRKSSSISAILRNNLNILSLVYLQFYNWNHRLLKASDLIKRSEILSHSLYNRPGRRCE